MSLFFHKAKGLGTLQRREVSPLPFLAVEFVCRNAVQQQLVGARAGSGLEASAHPHAGTVRRDDKAIVFHAKIHGVTESALLDQRLRYAQTSGIPDSDQSRLA